MNTRIAAALVLILTVTVAAVLLANRDSAAPAATPAPEVEATVMPDASNTPGTVTVTLGRGAFTPDEVTVEAGQSILFVNESGAPAIVASDPHPTHTDLGGFESGTLESGASYLFVFNERGSWGFHNHLNPSHTGTVIVR